MDEIGVVTRSASLRQRATLQSTSRGAAADSAQDASEAALERSFSAETVDLSNGAEGVCDSSPSPCTSLHRTASTDTPPATLSNSNPPDETDADHSFHNSSVETILLSDEASSPPPPVTPSLHARPRVSLFARSSSSQSCGSGNDGKTCNDNDEDEDNCCAICLQKMVHPVRLPCGHVFCFLCLKGVTLTNGLVCPMCRGVIPANFLQQPTLVTLPSPAPIRPRSSRSVSNERRRRGRPHLPRYQWFYEGHNGWWRYDERTNEEIEEAHCRGDESICLLIAGSNFTIDLVNMTQQKSSGHGMIRKIKRDSPDCAAKGTAGLHSKTLAGNKRPRRRQSRGE